MWIELNPHNNLGIVPHGSPVEIDRFQADMDADSALACQMAAVGVRSNAEVFGDTPLPGGAASRLESSRATQSRVAASAGYLMLAS